MRGSVPDGRTRSHESSAKTEAQAVFVAHLDRLHTRDARRVEAGQDVERHLTRPHQRVEDKGDDFVGRHQSAGLVERARAVAVAVGQKAGMGLSAQDE